MNNTYQWQDNATWTHGKHTARFGGEYTWAKPFSDFLPQYQGTYTFASFDTFMQNTPAQIAITDGPFRIRYHDKQVATYFQDDWRLRSNLTVNLGLRWEWFQNTLNQLHEFSVAQQTGPNPFWSTALPLSRTTVPAFAEDKNNFGPVVGFAYSVKEKTVVRGGFRIAYDPTFYNIHLNVASSAPFVNAGTIAAGTDPIVPGLPTTGFTAVNARATALPFLNRGVDPGLRNQSQVVTNFKNPYSEQWNLGISQEINRKSALEVRYLGNHTLGLFQQINGNPSVTSLLSNGFSRFVPAGLTACADATQPGFASGYVDCSRRRVLTRTNTGSSNYNGLQSKFDVRSFHGVTGTLSYTWSHSIDNASDIFSTTGAGMLAVSQNPFNYTSAERSNSNFDYRHTVGLQIIYDLPFYQGQANWMGKLLGGWELTPTYRYATGQPWTPIQSKTSTFCDPTSTFSSTTDACRPILLDNSAPFNSVGRISTLTAGVPTVVNVATGATTSLDQVHWLINNNNAALYFGNPFLGVSRNILNGQPTHATNFAVQKNTKINERLTFQLRATAYNVLNHQFLGVPGNNVNRASTSFGNWAFNTAGGGNPNTLESGLSRRRLEFGGKVIF